ncbi:Guanine nucleotide-binding protein subunit gamma, partial [Trichinella zimbabwensis]
LGIILFWLFCLLVGMSKAAQAQIESLRHQLEQLRMEASLPRKRISEVSRDLMDYCEKHKSQDVLVTGIADSHNPFQEKKSCVLL